MNAIPADMPSKGSPRLARIAADEKLAVMGQLTSGMLHDFNNMLGIISGNAALALDEMQTQSVGYGELREIAFAACRAQTLARHILAFGRSFEFTCSRVPANSIVMNTYQLMKSTVPDSVTVKLALNSEPLFVNADQCLLEQVVLNLCKNAVQAMPEGGTLTIKTHEIHGKQTSFAGGAPRQRIAAIKVFDTGCGVPQQDIEKIFEPFYSTKCSDQGTGLGLFISKYIVQNHGGTIHVNSMPGSGTIFSVYLPLAS